MNVTAAIEVQHADLVTSTKQEAQSLLTTRALLALCPVVSVTSKLLFVSKSPANTTNLRALHQYNHWKPNLSCTA